MIRQDVSEITTTIRDLKRATKNDLTLIVMLDGIVLDQLGQSMKSQKPQSGDGEEE